MRSIPPGFTVRVVDRNEAVVILPDDDKVFVNIRPNFVGFDVVRQSNGNSIGNVHNTLTEAIDYVLGYFGDLFRERYVLVVGIDVDGQRCAVIEVGSWKRITPAIRWSLGALGVPLGEVISRVPSACTWQDYDLPSVDYSDAIVRGVTVNTYSEHEGTTDSIHLDWEVDDFQSTGKDN
jgi:hypothetical protein